MKKVFYLFFITVFVITLTSCTADADDTIQVKLVKKIIEVNEDETSSTFSFTYDGKKIISIESEETTKTFTYTDDLITKIIELNKTTQAQTTFDYFYTNDLLTKVISSNNYTLNYTHQSDGTITYEKTTTDVNSTIVLLFHGTLSLSADNIIKDAKTLDTTNANIVSKEEFNYVYDTKLNPLRNIVGFNKLLDHSEIISKNNVASFFEINSTKFLDTDTETSSLVPFTKKHNYDKEGYPKEVISTKPVFGNKNQNHLKSMYFYE